MFRASNRHALRGLYRCSICPVPGPLHCPRQARPLHEAAEPYSGPPSYATLARRFSPSSPSPIRYFTQKKANEAILRGQFVDVHAIGGVDPKDYDVLITDLNHEKLESEISELVGIPFLKEATKDEAEIVATKMHGFIYGRLFRPILPCVLTINGISRWVFFIVDSGAPLTFISIQVAKAFGLKEEEDPWLAKIAGHTHPIYVSPKDSHFASVNLLGFDFCTMNKVRLCVHDSRTVTLYMGKSWSHPQWEGPQTVAKT